MNAKQLISALLSAILALLGFASCEKNNMSCEYGTPISYYKFGGVVTTEEGNPIKGIQVYVKVAKPEEGEMPDMSCVVYTNSKGVYDTGLVYASEFINKSHIEKVTFKDVDGEANGGEFETKELSLDDFTSGAAEDDGHWTTIYPKSADVKLEKKK